MPKRKLYMIIALIVLLCVCIALMLVSLLSSQATFAKISSYIAIFGVLISLIGVVMIIRMNSSTKENREQIREIEKLLEQERMKNKESESKN